MVPSLTGTNNVRSIHTLLGTAIQHPELFARDALRARKLALVHGTPDWLNDRINEAWEPTAADLRQLKKQLAPYTAKFQAVYAPIRHQVFGHSIVTERQMLQELFARIPSPLEMTGSWVAIGYVGDGETPSFNCDGVMRGPTSWSLPHNALRHGVPSSRHRMNFKLKMPKVLNAMDLCPCGSQRRFQEVLPQSGRCDGHLYGLIGQLRRFFGGALATMFISVWGSNHD